MIGASSLSPRRSLATRFVVVFAAFVVVGSLFLLAWLQLQQQAEEERVFLRLAHTDADFVQRMNLPRSAKLAEDLRLLLHMDIYFRDAEGRFEPELADDLLQVLKAAPRNEVRALAGGQQWLVLRLDARHDMVFVRPAPEATLSLWHPATRNALLAFWLLSAALGWVIAGQVVRPVARLTRGLSGFFESKSHVPAEITRRDEIGELARALTQARDGLLDEREKRAQSERMAMLGRVATGLAHEIKNPLAAIQLHTQLMDVTALDAESAQSLQHVQAEAKVIEGLVNQWLYLTRPVPPKMQSLDLGEVLAETIETLRAQADHAGVNVHANAPLGRARLLGDRARLQQAFRNVMLNAIQAMPRGGDLRIEITVGGLLFHDSGAGFSEAALAHGADLFFSEKEGGMGVGLNVVQEIITAHGGSIVLKNHPDGGAVVVIELQMT
ncbi:MAG: HAMP domain-containing sensor histidine kinase [Prosthecobacter sp.]